MHARFSFWRRPVGWILLLIVAGVAATAWLRPPPACAVIAAQVREVVEVVVVSGQLRAVREARLGVEVGGTVASVEVREGDRVRAGAVLLRVQLLDYDPQLAQAEARQSQAEQEMALAEADHVLAARVAGRVAWLFPHGLLSDDDLDRATTARARAVAGGAAARARRRDATVQVEVVRRQAEKREVRAPFDGLVVRRAVEPGQSVTPGDALLWVAETGNQEIYVETDEANLGRLKVGQHALAVSPAFRDRPFKAELTLIGPRVDWDRGLVGLRLTPLELPAYALPNMTVDLSIETNRWSGRPALPAAAVLRDRTGATVLVAEGERLERRTVTILGENPQWIVIDGLPAGARVAARAAEAEAGRRYRFVAAGPGA